MAKWLTTGRCISFLHQEGRPNRPARWVTDAPADRHIHTDKSQARKLTGMVAKGGAWTMPIETTYAVRLLNQDKGHRRNNKSFKKKGCWLTDVSQIRWGGWLSELLVNGWRIRDGEMTTHLLTHWVCRQRQTFFSSGRPHCVIDSILATQRKASKTDSPTDGTLPK